MLKIHVSFVILLVTCYFHSNAQLIKDKKWYEHAAFYQIYPRSFKDSDGDGVGDLKGIIENLDHLKDAGMTACWLSPIFESPQVDLGYDVADFYKIHHEYGTMDDFDNLMKKAKELDIKVMLDFIPNHTSDMHEWFQKSINNETKYRDYYVWHDGIPNPNGGGQPLVPNNWISVFGGSQWTWNDKRQQYFLHQFTAGQPDLNYRNPEVVKEMTEVLKYYIEKGCSGFRLDAINHMFEDAEFRNEPRNPWNNDPTSYDYLDHIYTKDLDEVYDMVYTWRELLDKESGEEPIILMTEAYADTRNTMRYYASEDGKRMGAHMPFNFQLIYNFNADRSAVQIKRGIDEWIDNMPGGFTADWVAGSHDHSRVASRIDMDIVNAVNAIVLTLPGASVTYYGEEIGMQDNTRFEIVVDNRDPGRTPMQWNDSPFAGFTSGNQTWLPVHINYRKINLKREKLLQKGVYKFFQSLTKLRQEDAFVYGGLDVKVINSRVLAYSRELREHKSYIVAINVDEREHKVDLSRFRTFPDDLEVVAASPESVYEVGDKVKIQDVALSRFDAVVLST